MCWLLTLKGNGSLAMGMEVTLYFTFWGLERLKKGWLERGPLSKMHLLGLGKWMVKRRMKKANVASLEKLMDDYKELGGRVIACEMTMEIMGIRREDLRAGESDPRVDRIGRGRLRDDLDGLVELLRGDAVVVVDVDGVHAEALEVPAVRRLAREAAHVPVAALDELGGDVTAQEPGGAGQSHQGEAVVRAAHARARS